MKNHSKIDISKLVDGTNVLVHVVDELPDYRDWESILERNCYSKEDKR